MTAETNATPVPLTPPVTGRLPMPDCSKRRDPVVIEPNDGLTREERNKLVDQAFDELRRSGTYDWEFVLRMREFDREQAREEMERWWS